MAGHSKWKNIQHRKGAQDTRRGKVFSKISREITIAVKLGGEDPDSNARLRLVLSKARAANMPKDNIVRAIKKASGGQDGANFSEKIYEGFAVAGSAFLVCCLTDNANRTASEVRHAFSKYNGHLGAEGAVAWMFKKIGVLIYDRSQLGDYEKFIDTAVEHGADDVEEVGDTEEDAVEVICSPKNLTQLRTVLNTLGAPRVEDIVYEPETRIEISEGQAETIGKLLEHLEDLDDVQDVYHNVKGT